MNPINPVNIDDPFDLFMLFNLIKNEMKAPKAKLAVCSDLVSIYQLPITPNALRKRFDRYIEAGEKLDARNKLRLSEELGLIGVLEGFCFLNHPIPRLEVISFVAERWMKGIEFDGEAWMRKLLERYHSRVTLKMVRSLTLSRCERVVYEHFESFIEYFRFSMDTYHVPTNLILNADETRFSLNPKTFRIKAVVSRKHPMPVFEEPHKEKFATYIPFVNSNRILFHCIILPNTEMSSEEAWKKVAGPRTRQHAPPLYYFYSDTGYLKNKVWLTIMKVFSSEMEILYPNQKILLLLDNLKIHSSIESVEYAKTHNIECIYFPRYSTHFFQPLDQYMFENLKQVLRKTYSKIMVVNSRIDKLCLALTSILDDVQNILTPTVISSSWSIVGIIPFSSEKILELARIHCKKEISDNSGDIHDNITSIAVGIIEHSMSSSSHSIDPVIDPTKFEKVILSNNKHERCETTQTTESDATITPNKSKKSRKSATMQSLTPNQKIPILFCFSQFHNEGNPCDSKAKSAWEICDTCKKFRMCSNCFQQDPEIFLSHTSVCSELQKKKEKKAKKEREKNA